MEQKQYLEFIECVKKINTKQRMDIIVEDMKKGNIDKAYNESIMLKNEFEKNCKLVDSSEYAYYTFSNNMECVHHSLIKIKSGFKGNIIEINICPFHSMYKIFAYIFIEKKEYANAQDALMKALRWNPVSAEIYLELAEIFIRNNDFKNAFTAINNAFKYACDFEILAMTYRKLGYCYIELQNYKLASALYTHSLNFVDNGVARNELDYIKDLAGENFTLPSKEEAAQCLIVNGIETQVSKMVCVVYMKLLQAADNEENQELLDYYKTNFSKVLFDKELKTQIQRLVLTKNVNK